MRTYCTNDELARLATDTAGAALYIEPPTWTPFGETLHNLVQRAIEAMNTQPCSAEIQLRQGRWLNSNQIRQLAMRFGEVG